MAGKDVSTMKISPKVWKNGEFINWEDARIHVMSHVVNYGSSVFEGIRCYETSKGSAVFRLTDHMQRLINSAKIYRMSSPFSRTDFCNATVELIRQSGLESCYIRPVVFRGLDEEKPAFGVNPFPNPIESYIAIWQWGKYLGEEALESGIDVCVSSWTRITSNSSSVRAATDGLTARTCGVMATVPRPTKFLMGSWPSLPDTTGLMAITLELPRMIV